jgi:hypothetical protein
MPNREIGNEIAKLVHGACREDLRFYMDIIREEWKRQDRLFAYSFRVGDRVSFIARGVPLFGVVKKVNQSTVTVITDKGMPWRVSSGLLRRVKEKD